MCPIKLIKNVFVWRKKKENLQDNCFLAILLVGRDHSYLAPSQLKVIFHHLSPADRTDFIHTHYTQGWFSRPLQSRPSLTNLKISTNRLDVNCLNLIMLCPYDFPTTVHTSNRYFTTNLYHNGTFIISYNNPVNKISFTIQNKELVLKNS